MAKVRKFLCLTVLTLLFSALVTSPTFAASSVSNWHVDLTSTEPVDVGQSFSVEAGSTVTLRVDQYVKDSNGTEDKTKAANVTYYLYNVVTGDDSFSFPVWKSVGGAHGDPAECHFLGVKKGTYVFKAKNNISSTVATGGNVYVGK